MNPRVLVVDDDPDIRLVLGLQLRRYGWTVREAATGDEAFDRVRDEQFDAVILDHRMPGAWGISVARDLRERGFSAPILLFSAYLGPEVEAEAAELGVDTFAKTATDELVAEVRAILEPQRSWWGRLLDVLTGGGPRG